MVLGVRKYIYEIKILTYVALKVKRALFLGNVAV